MSEQAFQKNVVELGVGVEVCLAKGLHTPALVLLYSAIDIAAWLDNDDGAGVRVAFTRWVDRYLLRARPLVCDAVDLYAARCGLVHTLTAGSRLADDGKAREVYYAWGDARASDLQTAIERMGRQATCVAVHVGDLLDGWREGMLLFHGEMGADPARAARVYARAGRFFGGLSTAEVDRFIGQTGGRCGGGNA